MKIAVVGKGGREAAICWKLAASDLSTEIVAYPGNPGIANGKVRCAGFKTTDDLIEKIVSEQFDYVVIGQEKYLDEGIIDKLISLKVPCIGPVQAASKLESSKSFCKEIFVEADVPTAKYSHFLSESALSEYTHQEIKKRHLVLKWDYLAEGKGVFICTDNDSLQEALLQLKALGDAQGKFSVLVEECLEGKEFSAFCLVDGNSIKYFSSACDYKRLNSKRGSPNTGGMGTYSPADIINSNEEDLVLGYANRIVKAMGAKGIEYNGVLFLGCMQVGEITYLLEVNTRFGDPETQSILPRLNTDLALICQKMSERKGKLKDVDLEWSKDYAVHVVKADPNYPTGKKQSVIIETQSNPDVLVFYAGVEMKDNRLYTNGGRIFGLTAVSATKASARDLVYKNLKAASFDNEIFREDIGC
ncbi:MAG: phosphoribosylamine--glycine ligase [Bdellovibrionales bacterium]|nr:phosphoribosylamine--glycine ligase [Bdellovibrionales bacterium]